MKKPHPADRVHPEDDFPGVEILRSRVHLVSAAEAVAWMVRHIERRDGRCRQVVVTGFHGLWASFQDADLAAVLNAADLWVPDGIAPVWIARLKGARAVRRVPGAELMSRFFETAGPRGGFRSYFYGDTEATLDALRGTLERTCPGHRIVGMYAPPFRALTPEEEAEHVRQINAARPDVLWVGLGLPRQDLWIHRNLPRLDVPVAIGVGAAFRFMAGTVKRAPEWIGRMGLEWLWRLAHEPRKCWRRCLIDGPQFLVHVVLELTGVRKYGRHPPAPRPGTPV